MGELPDAILFTQCLQNDFVKPIGRYEALPNRLHVGAEEARRLMGDNPADGPVARMMEWAYARSPRELAIVHIIDWHSESDPAQAGHIRQFGQHCIDGTGGADFAFDVPSGGAGRATIIRSLALDDFHETNLTAALEPYAKRPVRTGIMGVWTEAKVFFLAYELRSRYPNMDLAVCSALSASSSRGHHFMALEQLKRILDIRICDSIGEFIDFLGGCSVDFPLTGLHAQYPTLTQESGPALSPADDQLLRYLFRNCRSVSARVLDGGFSGNAVLGTNSIDLQGHEEVVHVVKIGPRDAIGQERTAFERIEGVLGNNAPRISDFADFGGRGAVKYRYASMGGGSVTTFQKQYMRGMPLEKVRQVMVAVFDEQLGRLYRAAESESCNLLDYYCFDSKWAPGVRRRVEAVLGRPAAGETLQLDVGPEFPNLCLFYERDFGLLDPMRQDSAYFSYVHGDLNGANIILDAHENIWLIDFFHTHRGHVLKDLIKLENDLLYIFTPLNSAGDLCQALELTDHLLAIEDIAAPLPAAPEKLCLPQLRRAWEMMGILRGFYSKLIRSDRSAFQWLVGAMRYAVHTLSFDESSELQKKWALYTASLCSRKILDSITGRETLRMDSVQPRFSAPGRLSITILPGRRDWQRSLKSDMAAIRLETVAAVVCLLPREELAGYGVPKLLDAYGANGIETHHLPILDQKVCSEVEMRLAVGWIRDRVECGKHVLVHCAGGLGRSGLIVACYLVSLGLTAEEALDEVRGARGPRAVETEVQEQFVRGFAWR